MELEMQRRQQVLAASSTDDITLLSKKKKKPVGKTRSNDIPYQVIPDCSSSGGSQISKQRQSFTLGATPPPPSRPSQQRSKVLKEPDRVLHSISYKPSQPQVVKATDIDTGMSVMVVSDVDSSKAKKRSSPSKVPNVTPVHEKLIQPAPSRRPIIHLHAKSLDNEPSSSSQKDPSSSDRKHRNRSTSPSFDGNDVLRLKNRFEGLMTQPSSISSKPAVVAPTQSHSQSRTGTGHHSSTENSDSGRESMLDSADVIPEPPTAY